MFIRQYPWTEQRWLSDPDRIWKFWLTISNIRICNTQFYAFLHCSPSLNGHNSFNTFLYVELLNIFSKLASFYLCIIKQILNDKRHDLHWGFLNALSFLQLLMNLINLFNFKFCINVASYDLFNLLVQEFLFNDLRFNRVEWISKLMWDTSVN